MIIELPKHIEKYLECPTGKKMTNFKIPKSSQLQALEIFLPLV